MNTSISQTSPAYYTALLRYNKILDQRNTLLKNRDAELIWIRSPSGMNGFQIRRGQKRAGFLKKLAPYAKELHAFLTDGAEEIGDFPRQGKRGRGGRNRGKT